MQFRDASDSRKPLALFSQSSLTDIVLLLLIFFLLTSSFVVNSGIKVDVPQSESVAQADPVYINVTITADGVFYVGAERFVAAELAGKIRTELSQKPNSTLVIRADKNAKVNDAVRVMNIGKVLEMPILVATEPEGAN
jgi:biopolymer transport protein ExbD